MTPVSAKGKIYLVIYYFTIANQDDIMNNRLHTLIKPSLILGISVLASLGLVTTAHADQHCSKGYTTFMCQAKNGKQIKVCALHGKYIYTYGKPNKPEITLKRTYDQAVSKKPIALEFVNGRHTYRVNSGGYDDRGKTWLGSVTIYRGAKKVGGVKCDKNKPNIDYISDAYAGK